MRVRLLSLLFLCSVFIISSCTGGDDDPEDDSSGFSKAEMLKTYADDVIIPRYEEARKAAEQLNNDIADFENGKLGLLELQNSFLSSYESWQMVSPYEFGPAGDISLRSSLNIFPTDTAKIESNIDDGGYNLDQASNLAAKGFPAIDYLLFESNQSTIISKFENQARINYLKEVAADISSKLNSVENDWKSSYRSTFIEADGTDVGSSLGLMVNNFNIDLELIKNAKVGIPLGKKSLGEAFPDKVEAYYSEYSLKLIEANTRALESFYLGRDLEGNDLPGMDDYLNSLGGNSKNIDASIKSQFTEIYNSIDALNSPLSEKINTEKSKVDALHEAIQQMVVYTKVDMSSAMGVLITYQDNDGD